MYTTDNIVRRKKIVSGKGKELHNFSKLWPELHKLKSTKLMTKENTISLAKSFKIISMSDRLFFLRLESLKDSDHQPNKSWATIA